MPGRRAQGGQGHGHTHTLAWGFFLEKSQARPRSEMRTCPNSSRRMFAGCQDTVPPLSSSTARGHGVGSEAGGAHMGQVGDLGVSVGPGSAGGVYECPWRSWDACTVPRVPKESGVGSCRVSGAHGTWGCPPGCGSAHGV